MSDKLLSVVCHHNQNFAKLFFNQKIAAAF